MPGAGTREWPEVAEMTRWTMVVLALVLGAVAFAQQGPNPRQQPGAAVTLFAPDQHDLYDGHFVLCAGRLYMVGGLNDTSPWDHMDNAASTVRTVGGTAEIDVDEKANTGRSPKRRWAGPVATREARGASRQ